jgi:hypothetical protein
MDRASTSPNDRAGLDPQSVNVARVGAIAFARTFGRHLSRMQSDA